MLDWAIYFGGFVLTLAIAGLVSFIYFVNRQIRRRSLFRDMILEENVLITSEWLEIDTEGVVMITHDVHLIGIFLSPPFEIPLGERGIRAENGEITNPEIKLIDNDNNEHIFLHSGARGTAISNYRYDGTLPKNVTFKKVLLGSKYPIKARKILWTGYDIKDLK